MLRTKSLIALLVSVLILTLASCSGESAKREAGERAIAKIEQFRERNKRLPASLAEVGIDETESGPVHYQKRNENGYIIWYGTTLGESVTYYSETRRWE